MSNDNMVEEFARHLNSDLKIDTSDAFQELLDLGMKSRNTSPMSSIHAAVKVRFMKRHLAQPFGSI